MEWPGLPQKAHSSVLSVFCSAHLVEVRVRVRFRVRVRIRVRVSAQGVHGVAAWDAVGVQPGVHGAAAWGFL